MRPEVSFWRHLFSVWGKESDPTAYRIKLAQTQLVLLALKRILMLKTCMVCQIVQHILINQTNAWQKQGSASKLIFQTYSNNIISTEIRNNTKAHFKGQHWLSILHIILFSRTALFRSYKLAVSYHQSRSSVDSSGLCGCWLTIALRMVKFQIGQRNFWAYY